jgi:hypothetical protein
LAAEKKKKNPPFGLLTHYPWCATEKEREKRKEKKKEEGRNIGNMVSTIIAHTVLLLS